jgi:hypothetical protein
VDKLLAMLKRFVVPELLLAGLMFSPLARAQSAPPQPEIPKNQKNAPAAAASVDYDGWGRPMPEPAKDQKSAPAPPHDISGTWDPANGHEDGGQFLGAKTLPVDGKPGHEPPYTPEGLQAYLRTKPGNGARMVAPTKSSAIPRDFLARTFSS